MFRHLVGFGVGVIGLAFGHQLAWSQVWPGTPPATSRSAAPIDPSRRVHELLTSLRQDPKADRREHAAFSLRSFPADKYFEILPTLVECLAQESEPAVRRAIVQTLGELRPRSAEALEALQHAAEHDPSWRVRQSARWAKRGYKVETPAAPVPTSPAAGDMPAPSSAKAGPGSMLPPPGQPLPPLPLPSEPKRQWTLFPWLRKKETVPSPPPILAPSEPILAAPPRSPGQSP
jgi:hypothetical protein